MSDKNDKVDTTPKEPTKTTEESNTEQNSSEESKIEEKSPTTIPVSSGEAPLPAGSVAQDINSVLPPPLEAPSEDETKEDLTQRLQKLALERQKENRHDALRVIQSDTSSHLSSARTFQELNLPSHLLNAVFAMGFDRPSAIQEEALPRILDGRNVIGQAQSGSGKTAAFVLGMLYRIVVDEPATTQALCVTPTRELAVQIYNKTVAPMAANMQGLAVRLALSGELISRGDNVNAHMVIGTPGKIVNWIKSGALKTRNMKVFVLDEADNLVEEGGHRANSVLIKKQLPRNVQHLLFSATFPPRVVEFATKMVYKPDKILIASGPEYLILDVIKQIWIDTQAYDGGKLQFLSDIYNLMTIGQSIVFVGTKNSADEVHRTLMDGGFSCSVLHGKVEARDRDTTMEDFRRGNSSVLITTNVLARGVDVDNVCLVVNYDPPTTKDGEPDYETYLHRIGRTGRFGRKGTAINLIGSQADIEVLASIEQHFSVDGKEMIHNVEPDPEALAEQIEI